jgi:hypothetical protein
MQPHRGTEHTVDCAAGSTSSQGKGFASVGMVVRTHPGHTHVFDLLIGCR